jgi:crotonobetainyl-CoA:carnitine CoA-transferase CaiB-like acyl-CoA transferase
MAGPLESTRVVDLTDLRGALCSRILADLGADVIRIMAPGDDVGPRLSHAYRNANKRGATLDIHARTGSVALEPYLASADVLVENLGPTEGASHHLAPMEVAGRHPHLVHVALADFGLSGPRSGWRLEPLPALAASGTLHASGFPDRPPCWMPGHLAHDCASVYGAIGAVAALMDRARTGRGQLVEVSVQEAALAGTVPWSVVLQDYLKINPLLPAAGKRNADGTYWVLPAADGWIRTVIGNAKQWRGFLALLGNPDVLEQPEWKDPLYRIMNGDVVRLIAEERLTDRTRAELFEEAAQTGATIGVINRPSEFTAHPQPRARQVFLETGFAEMDGAPFVAPPLRLSATPSSLRRSAPRGGDSAVPWEARDVAEPSPNSAAGLLLEGVRVVEFGMAAVVPETCMVLSELGADVIKIESETHLDVLRATGMGRINCGFAFNAECRGRRSVALNLESAEGRRLALQLCATADVVAENYRGGVLDGLGLGFEDVKKVNPAVIYVSSQGYGREGPLARVPAYGPLNLGFVGLHGLWNHPDSPYPCGTTLNHPDHIAGKLLAVGVLAALDHRRRTGEGQLVDMAQTDAAAFLLGEVYLETFTSGADPQPLGNASPDAVPHGVYPAAGDDSWLAVAVPDDAAWTRLCHALGWQESPDEATLAGRLELRVEIDERMAKWSSTQPAADAAGFLQERGVSAMAVLGPLDHLSDTHLAERDFIVQLHHPEVGDERHAGNPLRMSTLLQRRAASAPCLGADTEDVLTSVLGMTKADVEALVEKGVCR